MIIGIDWNNTIQDMIGEIIYLSGYRLNRQDFEIWDDPGGAAKLGMSEREFIDFCWKNKRIQTQSSPFPGVKEAFERLRAAGHTIRIITASFLPISQIVKWFDTHQIPFDEIVKEKNKERIYFDLLIDDNPEVLTRLIELELPILKFSLPWNSHINCPGFSDWNLVKIGPLSAVDTTKQKALSARVRGPL